MGVSTRCGVSLVALCMVALAATRVRVDARRLHGGDDIAQHHVVDTPPVQPRGGHSVTKVQPNSGFTVDPFLSVGGNTGQPAFFWNPDEGGLMQKIEVWVGDWEVRGIRVVLSTGDVQMFGETSGDNSSLTLQPGETITQASLWDNGLAEPRTRFGAILLATDRNNSFDAGLPRYKRGPEHKLALGSGMVVAAAGRTSTDVVAFGLCFVREVASARLVVDEYPTLQTLSPAGGQMAAVLAYVTYNNFGDSEQRVRMSGSPSVTAYHSWNSDFIQWLSVPVPVEAGVPRVVDADGIPTNWTVSATSTWDVYSEEDVTRAYDLPLTVPPHTSMEAKATLAKLNVNVEFMGTVTVTCDNGAIWQPQLVGRYKGLAYAITVTLGKNATIGTSAAEPRAGSGQIQHPVYIV